MGHQRSEIHKNGFCIIDHRLAAVTPGSHFFRLLDFPSCLLIERIVYSAGFSVDDPVDIPYGWQGPMGQIHYFEHFILLLIAVRDHFFQGHKQFFIGISPGKGFWQPDVGEFHHGSGDLNNITFVDIQWNLHLKRSFRIFDPIVFVRIIILFIVKPQPQITDGFFFFIHHVEEFHVD